LQGIVELAIVSSMAWDDDLVGVAKNIAAMDRTPLRVMAGPGTGKSFAMKRRVARLLEHGQSPKRILAVTFTRTAAASLVNDLRGLNVPGCESIRAGTLHAFCFGLLNSQQVFEYLDRIARPIVTFLKGGVLQCEGNAMLEELEKNGFLDDLARHGARLHCLAVGLVMPFIPQSGDCQRRRPVPSGEVPWLLTVGRILPFVIAGDWD
jgi:AAA domain